jgi:uncharacterized protein
MSKEHESYSPPSAESPNTGSSLSSEVRNWAMGCHLAALAGFVIPFGSVVGPLIVWLLKRDENEFINTNGKEALNFQITVMIAFLISALLALVLIGFLLMAIVGIGALVLAIVAAVKASNGEDYRYPFTLRLIN